MTKLAELPARWREDATTNEEANWSDAPEWANYKATDRDDSGWWYEHKPILSDYYWVESTGRFLRVVPLIICENWEDTLEKRDDK